jgi:hypothetical protein
MTAAVLSAIGNVGLGVIWLVAVAECSQRKMSEFGKIT